MSEIKPETDTEFETETNASTESDTQIQEKVSNLNLDTYVPDCKEKLASTLELIKSVDDFLSKNSSNIQKVLEIKLDELKKCTDIGKVFGNSDELKTLQSEMDGTATSSGGRRRGTRRHRKKSRKNNRLR